MFEAVPQHRSGADGIDGLRERFLIGSLASGLFDQFGALGFKINLAARHRAAASVLKGPCAMSRTEAQWGDAGRNQNYAL
ncbi:MAG: hypothetical protein B7Y35_13285 [Sphingomonadales bacterium 28-64-96]|nr:MAG: hypothetical protein B7Y35_13285 [Sphingomonadales bacterium 28-64-96]